MQNRLEKRSGFAGERMLLVPARALAAAARRHPGLRGLVAAGAGYFPKAAGHLRRRSSGVPEAILIYCLKGGGWCELAGHLHPVRKGDLLVLPPQRPHAYGTHASNPWTIHWVHAGGDQMGEYLEALGVTGQQPVMHLGEDMQVVALFSEVLQDLLRGDGARELFHAAHALGHLLSVLIRHRHTRQPEAADSVQKVAQTIIHMSEHVHQPLRVTDLAALAGLSTAHFTVLFKQQTGCAPRDYLQMLRIHEACQWLRTTPLSIKEVAARTGYEDPLHFSRAFKAFNGVSPSEYRATLKP